MMRSSVLFLFLLSAALSGAEGSEGRTPPNTFSTLSECQEALVSGDVRFYEPRYFGLRTKDPVNGGDRILVPLESDTCLEMLVVGGRRFVAQREGTLFRARRLSDGSLTLYARDDCGNPVYGAVYPAPRVVVEPLPHVQRAEPPPVSPRRVLSPLPIERWAPPPVHHEKEGGFCRSTKCRVALVAIGGAAAGYAAWRLWPCPPGTVRR